MENFTYNPDNNNLYDGPSDEELEKIEEEYSSFND